MKDKFTPDEWKQMLLAPSLASMPVVFASMSGPIGVVKEMMVSASAVMNASQDASVAPAIKEYATEIVGMIKNREKPELPKPDVELKSADAAKAYGLEQCGKLATLLETKLGADAPAFKTWLLGIAEKTAEASKEGGFLGIGGERVSEAEKTALAEIKNALRA